MRFFLFRRSIFPFSSAYFFPILPPWFFPILQPCFTCFVTRLKSFLRALSSLRSIDLDNRHSTNLKLQHIVPKYATERPIYAQSKLRTRQTARTFKGIVGLVKQASFEKASLDYKRILDTAKASTSPRLPCMRTKSSHSNASRKKQKLARLPCARTTNACLVSNCHFPICWPWSRFPLHA